MKKTIITILVIVLVALLGLIGYQYFNNNDNAENIEEKVEINNCVYKGENLTVEKINYLTDEDKIDSYKWLKEYNTKAIGQTNFYLNEDAWNIQEYKIGVGRFIELQKGICI